MNQESNLEQLLSLLVLLNMHLPISPTLPETNIAPARTPSQKETIVFQHLSTIHFQARWLLVSGRDIFCSHVSLSLGAETHSNHTMCHVCLQPWSLVLFLWQRTNGHLKSRWVINPNNHCRSVGFPREKCHGG